MSEYLRPLQDVLLYLGESVEPGLLVHLLQLGVPRVEEVRENAADGLEDVGGRDTVEVLDVPRLEQLDPLLHAEGLETLQEAVEVVPQDEGGEGFVAVLLSYQEEE